ncbi:MAG: Carboxymuconolactone decarboxylase [Actinomycetia bacterium]|nr:Carboxymuconolactone decarboxylase [Actinomycetes bacterium]
MARISYVEPSSLDDPDARELLEQARLHGTPRPESQAVRAHVPDVLRTFSAYWNATFADGLVDNRLKELCRLYVSKTVECSYCGGQRSEAARAQGLSEDLVDEILVFESSDSFDEREKTALAYTRAIAWNPDLADDALWAKLRQHFTEGQLVELGSFVSLTAGAQRWVKTLDLGHRELLGDTVAGLAAETA